MSKFTLLHESPNHFILHNGKASFHVAKKGISEPTADKIRSFASGGSVGPQTPYEAGIEAREKNIRAMPSQSADEAQIEGAEKNRRAQPAIDYIQENNPELKNKENSLNLAEGGKLSASDRKHIAPKNFAGPDRSYPIEDASHARNALARVSQHGSPELQAQVRAKVHSKYPGIEQSHSDGGEIEQVGPPQSTMPPQGTDTTEEQKRKEAQDSMRKAFGYSAGGPVESNSVKDISHETQSQAIKRYAAGNPATLAKGGNVPSPTGSIQDQGGEFPWHRNGKYHFHFYDGAPVTTPLDRQEGSGPQQPSALDKYVGGEPSQGTPLDEYTKMADGGEAPAPNSEGDKLEQAAQELQAELNSQTAPAPTDNFATSIVAASSPSMPAEAAAVPQSQQIPAVQKPLSPTPDQSPNMLSDFDKALNLEKTGIQQGANAQSEGYKQTAQVIGQNVLQQKQMQDAYRLEADKITQQNTQLFNDVASSKIDPNHFWNSKSTGGKIMATIGVILGGIGGGANGTNQNQALSTLQNHIQQDIEAQKNDQSNKMNLYKMGLERYRDAQSAQQFATLQSNALLQGQLQKIAATTGNSQAQATASQMIGQLGVQNAGIRSELAMKQAAFGAMNQPQGVQAGVDPNKMRLLINAGVIPKEEVPTAMKEYNDYTKLSNTLDHTDDVFKQAAANSTYTERALPGWTPTLRDKSKQYEAVTDAWLGQITKDTEGRVTPADIQLMKASLPKAGDNPQLIQTKLANIKDMIREKYAFPTLQSYRLLHPNNAVSTPAATRQKKFTEGPPK